jgi:hypothetical protein
MKDWQYAQIGKALAFRIGDRLVVGVAGPRLGPEYEVALRKYRSGRDGPAVRLECYVRRRPAPVEGAAPPFPARAEVNVRGREITTVRVVHASGFEDVPVQHLSAPGVRRGGDGAETYTGWSATSFDEAYRNALALLPRESRHDPVHATVAAQGGVHGGLPGLDYVFVTLRRAPAPTAAPPGAADGRRLKVVPD